MGILDKIFNKSDNKYYLEIDEAAEKASEILENVSDAAQEKAAEIAKSEPVKEAVKTASKVADKVSDKVADVVPEQLQSAIALETEAEKTKAQASKNGKQGKQTQKKPETSANRLKSAGASPDEPPFWVAAMYNNSSSSSSSSSSNGNNSEQTFATDNLMPIITKSRRRPGPSLDPFKAMAKEAKTPRR